MTMPGRLIHYLNHARTANEIPTWWLVSWALMRPIGGESETTSPSCWGTHFLYLSNPPSGSLPIIPCYTSRHVCTKKAIMSSYCDNNVLCPIISLQIHQAGVNTSLGPGLAPHKVRVQQLRLRSVPVRSLYQPWHTGEMVQTLHLAILNHPFIYSFLYQTKCHGPSSEWGCVLF